jgi:hypothetical protein
MAYVEHPLRNGKDHNTSLPQSRKAFQRSLPLRLGSVEEQLDTQDQSVEDIRTRLAALEARADDKSDAARVELLRNVVDVIRLALGKRRSRRRLK